MDVTESSAKQQHLQSVSLTVLTNWRDFGFEIRYSYLCLLTT